MAENARIRFQTETGSVYVLTRTEGAMCWHRESATFGCRPLRSDNGILARWPAVIELGASCELWSEPINPPFALLVWTSRMIAFLRVDQPAEGRI